MEVYMAISQFEAAINQICDEKGLSKEMVIETIEAAIASAYRKDFGQPDQKIKVKFDPLTGQSKVFEVYEVVTKVENEHNQIAKKDAAKIKKGIKVGDFLEKEVEPPAEYGRIAAQTAKQVVIQRIREAEREVLYKEFKTREGEILNGVVQQLEGKNIIINLGKANGVMFASEQIPGEKYYIGQRLKVYISSVEQTTKAPLISVSRTHPELIRRLFELEVPEINAGTVKIMSIAREAGKRTKMAVAATQEGVDPVGSCVGQRGTRVQAVLAEIGEEKIDIILWDEKPEQFIANALSPAKVLEVKLKPTMKSKVKKDEKGESDKKENETEIESQGEAEVTVAPDQLSLAIGREGQNVRLASKLTGWTINVVKKSEESGKEGKVEKEKKESNKKAPSSKSESQPEDAQKKKKQT